MGRVVTRAIAAHFGDVAAVVAITREPAMGRCSPARLASPVIPACYPNAPRAIEDQRPLNRRHPDPDLIRSCLVGVPAAKPMPIGATRFPSRVFAGGRFVRFCEHGTPGYWTDSVEGTPFDYWRTPLEGHHWRGDRIRPEQLGAGRRRRCTPRYVEMKSRGRQRPLCHHANSDSPPASRCGSLWDL